MIRFTLAAVIAFGLPFAAGCQEQREPALELTRQAFIMSDAEQMDDLWGVCQMVLRRSRFNLDQVDRRSGTITTFPVTSQQFFEFWRHDVDTGYDLAEASLQTMRRRAAVEMRSEATDPLTVSVRVTVNVERLSAPERQFNNSAMALRYFGEEVPGVGGQKQLRRKDDYWIPVGRDSAMEGYLLRRIVDHGAYVSLDDSSLDDSILDDSFFDDATQGDTGGSPADVREPEVEPPAVNKDDASPPEGHQPAARNPARS